MKKIIALAICLMLAQVSVWAKEKNIMTTELPEKAQKFITANLKDMPVMFVSMDEELFSTDYKVVFENGDKVEFNKDGEWTEIDFEKKGEVPGSAIPEPIKKHVNERHVNLKIVKIERENEGYDVKLNNDVDIKFDKNARFVKYDD